MVRHKLKCFHCLGVHFYLSIKNACSILVYAPATETMYIETCVAANGAAFFVRSFGCAFFIFRSLRVLFVIVLRAIQDGAKTV